MYPAWSHHQEHLGLSGRCTKSMTHATFMKGSQEVGAQRKEIFGLAVMSGKSVWKRKLLNGVFKGG